MAWPQQDSVMMARALELAAKGMCSTTPNPRVGCVIVDTRGSVLGEAYHQRAGEAHAEILALAEAGAAARGATAYVTLEPCSHYGRTGPCADALIEAGIARVVFAADDPNPQVDGSGAEKLRAAGVAVQSGLMDEAAVALNRGFFKRMRTGLPWLTCKLAMSLDGRTAMADGSSQWITSPAAREDVQHARARHCAVMTGIGTVLRDNPRLNVRLDACLRQPLRVVVDSRGRTPADAAIFGADGNCIVATSASAETLSAPNRTHWRLPMDNGHVDLHALLQRLGEEQCNDLMLEAGATLSGAFMARGLIDEVIIYMAGKLMGSTARPLFDLPIKSMPASLALSIKEVRAIGQDWRITALPDPYA